MNSKHWIETKRPKSLANKFCVYCNTSEELTKEHVIGRRFVPKGTLNNDWNLFIRACSGCNQKKADLEDDISAITLLYAAYFGLSLPKSVISEVQRKAAASRSRKTKQTVLGSKENLNFSGQIGPIDISFNFMSPPQIDKDRAFQLAYYHISAFFFLITYDESKSLGYTWDGIFAPAEVALKSDWGNPYLVGFAAQISHWEPRVIGTAAEGFFRVVIKKHPKRKCWAWGLEWNKSMRLVGFLGDQKLIEQIHNEIPKKDFTKFSEAQDVITRFRRETPIEDSADPLFNP